MQAGEVTETGEELKEQTKKDRQLKRESGSGRFRIFILLAIAAVPALVVWNICAGSVDISISDIIGAFSGRSIDESSRQIILQIRLPRTLAAFILGGALAVSGFLLQVFFANPIAGPYVLGISSGAKLVVAAVMIFLLGRGVTISSAGMVLAAFAGSLLAMGFVLLLSFRVRRMSTLVVCGVMIGYICSAFTDLAVTFADDSNIVNLHNWSQGSFSGMSWENVRIMAVIIAASMVCAMLLSKPISAYRMGENYARNMGVNIRLLRVFLILLSSLLSACVTAFVGPVSFVGMAVPHLVKNMIHTTEPRAMIPGCFLGGAAVTLLCDGIARVLFAPTEVSISSVTAVLLVPVVIVILLKNQSEKHA